MNFWTLEPHCFLYEPVCPEERLQRWGNDIHSWASMGYFFTTKSYGYTGWYMILWLLPFVFRLPPNDRNQVVDCFYLWKAWSKLWELIWVILEDGLEWKVMRNESKTWLWGGENLWNGSRIFLVFSYLKMDFSQEMRFFLRISKYFWRVFVNIQKLSFLAFFWILVWVFVYQNTCTYLRRMLAAYLIGSWWDSC